MSGGASGRGPLGMNGDIAGSIPAIGMAKRDASSAGNTQEEEIGDCRVNEWFLNLKPGQVLKWGGVVFAYALGILFLVNVIIATVKAHW